MTMRALVSADRPAAPILAPRRMCHCVCGDLSSRASTLSNMGRDVGVHETRFEVGGLLPQLYKSRAGGMRSGMRRSAAEACNQHASWPGASRADALTLAVISGRGGCSVVMRGRTCNEAELIRPNANSAKEIPANEIIIAEQAEGILSIGASMNEAEQALLRAATWARTPRPNHVTRQR